MLWMPELAALQLYREGFLEVTGPGSSLKVAIYSIWKSNFVMTIVAIKQIGGH